MFLKDEIEIALQALAKGTSVATVAEVSDRTPRTIQKWKADHLERYEELRNQFECNKFRVLLGLSEGDPDWEAREREIEEANQKQLNQVTKAKSLALKFFEAHSKKLEKATTNDQILEVLAEIPTRQLSAFAKLLETTINIERRITYLDVDLNRIATVAKKRGYYLVDTNPANQ